MATPGIRAQILVALAACIATLTGGFHVGWASPSLIKLQAEDSDLPVTSSQGSWIASIFNFGAIFGGLIAGLVVNRWGRKISLLATTAPYVVACILIGVAQNYQWLFIARFIAALGSGSANIISATYLGEIAHRRIRGALVVLINQMMSIGILLAYSVGPWVSREALAAVGLSLPIIFALVFVWMPESPYFLVMKKRTGAAERSLTWLRGTSVVHKELEQIEESIESEESGTFGELIMTSGNRKALLILTLVWLAPQMSGDAAILSYTSLIFEASGSGLSTSISVIIIGVTQLIAGVLSVFTVDLLGRRPLLLLSLCGSIVFLSGEALYFQLKAVGTDISSIPWLPVISLVGYVVSYAIGLGCLPFVILSEILPCNLKAPASTYCMTISSLCAMTGTKLFQIIADAYGIHVSFWGFAASSTLMTTYIFFVLPETKQSSLRDIQNGLRARKVFTPNCDSLDSANAELRKLYVHPSSQGTVKSEVAND